MSQKVNMNANYRQIAYVCMIIATILTCWLVLPLLWMVPMTILTKNAVNDNKPHIALGICEIIFSLTIFGLIAGIFLLLSHTYNSSNEDM